MIDGNKIIVIFGFCDIRNFTDSESFFDDWTANVNKNILGVSSKNKDKVVGYNVPSDVSGSTVRVYGIHVEVDPRSGIANDKIMVISIGGITNPSLAYSGTKNLFEVTYKKMLTSDNK